MGPEARVPATVMRYCGVDISATPGGQRLVTLHERRGPDDLELVATFYQAGDVEQVARTIEGFGRGEAVVAIAAPSGHRPEPLAGAPPAAAVEAAAGTPPAASAEGATGRDAGMRECEALLSRHGLPMYPPPARGQPRVAWDAWVRAGLALFDALAPLGRYVPDGEGRHGGEVGPLPLHRGRVFETYPDAIFCVLLGHRPSPKRTPWGLQQRIAALKLKGVVDEDGGLWHRTLDELDACAGAYAAYALAAGLGTWVGDPAEGVIVLPVSRLLDRYEQLPPPARATLA